MLFTLRNNLPKDLTSYDLLKSLALITMIIDHLGYYWFPDENWLRLVGRMSFPIWLFFVGYAKSRDLSLILWGGAFAVAVSGLVFGSHIFPVNILFSIILVRLFLDQTIRFTFHSRATLWLTPTLLVIMAFPTYYLFEYGALGIMVAMAGWMIRHKDEEKAVKTVLPWFFAVTILTHFVLTFLTFNFHGLQTQALAGLLMCSYALIYLFQIKTYPKLTEKLPNFVVLLLQFMGRYSLYIYVVHVLLLQFGALWMNSEKFGLFAWSWF